MCFDCKDYHISSNNSLPSINCLPLLGIFKLSPPSNTGNCPPPPTPSSIFSFSYPAELISGDSSSDEKGIDIEN